MNKGYYTDSAYVHLWVHLIMKATYQEREYLLNGKIEYLRPGQFIAGRKRLARETGIHESKIERILKTFEIEQQIEQVNKHKFRIISICNWSEYQESEQQTNSKRTASEQPVNTDNKDKKEKKKNIYSNFVLPEDINLEVWNAFVELRKNIKKPLTEYAKHLIVEKLNKIGQDKNLVLKKSIESGWQGVFPLKEEELPKEPTPEQPKGTRFYQNREGKWVNMDTGDVVDTLPEKKDNPATNLIQTIARSM